MATRKVTSDVKVCDRCRGWFEAETVVIKVDGKSREVELCPVHRAMLDKVLKPFLVNSRPASVQRRSTPKTARGRRTANSRTKTGETPEQREEIRAWARKHGFDIGTRGRISAEVREAHAADKSKARRRNASKPKPATKATNKPQLAVVRPAA